MRPGLTLLEEAGLKFANLIFFQDNNLPKNNLVKPNAHKTKCFPFLAPQAGFTDRTPYSTYVDKMTVNGEVSPTDGEPIVRDLDH